MQPDSLSTWLAVFPAQDSADKLRGLQGCLTQITRDPTSFDPFDAFLDAGQHLTASDMRAFPKQVKAYWSWHAVFAEFRGRAPLPSCNPRGGQFDSACSAIWESRFHQREFDERSTWILSTKELAKLTCKFKKGGAVCIDDPLQALTITAGYNFEKGLSNLSHLLSVRNQPVTMYWRVDHVLKNAMIEYDGDSVTGAAYGLLADFQHGRRADLARDRLVIATIKKEGPNDEMVEDAGAVEKLKALLARGGTEVDKLTTLKNIVVVGASESNLVEELFRSKEIRGVQVVSLEAFRATNH